MNESPETLVLTKESAEMQIKALRQECATMGADNSEPADFGEILNKLDNGELEPVAALEQASLIRSSKQDYH